MKGSGRDYIDVNVLLNREETGLLQLIPEIEREIFSLEEEYFHTVLREGIDHVKVVEFYEGIEEIVEEFYEYTIGVSLLK